MAPEEALQRLKDIWARDRDIRIVAWNAQLEQDQAEQEEQGRIAREEQEIQRARLEREADEQRREAEKKKPKFNNFDPNRQIPNFIKPRPAQYALNKISALEYVELDYFSLRGCSEATADTSSYADQDTFSLTQENGTFSIRSAAAHKASKHIRKDEELSWEEMMQAKNMMLEYIIDSKAWPATHIEALAGFFIALDTHPRALQPNGKQALLRYQSKARREWYTALKHDEGFNIETIGEELLRSLAETVNNEISERRFEEVRSFSLNPQNVPNLYLLPFIHLPFSINLSPPYATTHPSLNVGHADPTCVPLLLTHTAAICCHTTRWSPDSLTPCVPCSHVCVWCLVSQSAHPPMR